MVTASKGTDEDEEIFEKLKAIQYAYGDDEKDGDEDEEEIASDDEDQEDMELDGK